MKKWAISFFSFFLFTFIISQATLAQEETNELESTLSKLSQSAASKYVAPIVSGFGANLNSGWVHRAPSSKIFGIDFEIGFVFMGTMMGDDAKNFSSSGTFRFNKAQALQMVQNVSSNAAVRDALANELIKQDFNVNISGPTIVGSETEFVGVDFSGTNITVSGTSYTVPAQRVETPVSGYLKDLSVLPLFAPQFTIGTVYGTTASFRFLPSIEIGDLGKFSYFGFGLQHNPSMFIPVPIPLDVSVAFFTQSLKVGDIFDASATTFGLYASKQFGPGALSVTPYAGLAFESSSIKIKYNQIISDPTNPSQELKIPVDFELEGENSARFVLGASFKLALISINVDYSMAKYNSFSAGLGIAF
jgi:hypothetical protein